jgi:hypothetical protein
MTVDSRILFTCRYLTLTRLGMGSHPETKSQWFERSDSTVTFPYRSESCLRVTFRRIDTPVRACLKALAGWPYGSGVGSRLRKHLEYLQKECHVCYIP